MRVSPGVSLARTGGQGGHWRAPGQPLLLLGYKVTVLFLLGRLVRLLAEAARQRCSDVRFCPFPAVFIPIPPSERNTGALPGLAVSSFQLSRTDRLQQRGDFLVNVVQKMVPSTWWKKEPS